MNLTDSTEVLRRLSAIPESLRQQFEKKQYSKCVAGLEELAEQDILTSAIAVGHIYFFGGGGVRKNYALARRWLEVVDHVDYFPFAAYRLGIIYYKGLGVVSDHAMAYRYFRRAGLRGDLTSLFMTGWMLKEGDGVTKKTRSGKAVLFGCATNKTLGIHKRVLALAVAVGIL